MTLSHGFPEHAPHERESSTIVLPEEKGIIFSDGGTQEHHMALPKHRSDKIFFNPHFRRGYIAGTATMCLGIMGGDVLPVAWGFSISGITAGMVMAVVVAWSNVFTCDMLIRQCYKSGASDYEELAFATGGKIWLFITQISIVVLMFGSIISAMQQGAEAAVFALQTVWADRVPDWLLYKDDTGYLTLIMLVFLFSYPLCMVREMRSLEYAGMFGFIAVIWLVFVVVIQSIAAGLPAVSNGELSKNGFETLDGIGQAISVFGFAFYIQPIMMPLLAEMPGSPRHQARILSWSMRFVVIGFAFTVYVLVGVFGAAWNGHATDGNILKNTLMGGGVPQGVLNFIFSVYLAFSIPTLVMPARLIFNNWVPGDKSKMPFLRHVAISSFIICSCLAVAMFWNRGSAKIVVITASTGVFMSSYVLPVGNHFLLYFNLAKCQQEAEQMYKAEFEKMNPSRYEGTLPKFMDDQAVDMDEALPPIGPHCVQAIGVPGVLTYRKAIEDGWLPLMYEVITEIILPSFIILLGTFSSVVSLRETFK